MPELPEVEGFRQLLLPLVSKKEKLQIETHGDHHRLTLTSKDRAMIGVCHAVHRKGKQLALEVDYNKTKKFIFLHMGMTGHIRIEGQEANWGSKKFEGKEIKPDTQWPPRFTYLSFKAGKYIAYFCDSRKFGSCFLADNMDDLDALAPDCLSCDDDTIIKDQILPALTQQRLGIKAILLDQKRAVSGVGNWVADEVLYHVKMHPDQAQLTLEEATSVWKKLNELMKQAVESQEKGICYPDDWLFHCRWSKKKAAKDFRGRSLSFVTSGGRTSAIIAADQRLYKRKSSSTTTKTAKKSAPKSTSNEKKRKRETSSRKDVTKSRIVTPEAKATRRSARNKST